MSKKNWIMVKRGLSEDPKHRESMGMAVWVFLHMIDHADWETGIVYDWRDVEIAAEMGIPSTRTVRDWRDRLEKQGYITVVRKQHGLDIEILRWINPRSYAGTIINTPTGRHRQNSQTDIPMSISSDPDSAQIDTQISSENVSPSFNSESISTPNGGLTEDEIRQVNAKVDFMIDSQKKFKYSNRDKIPEAYLEYADTYNQLTGQEPTKRVIQDWLMAFSEWQGEGLITSDIKEAYQYANRPEGGFIVARPGSLTNTAVAFRSKRLSKKRVLEEKDNKTAEIIREFDEYRKTAVPQPDYLRQQVKAKLGGLAKKLEISK